MQAPAQFKINDRLFLVRFNAPGWGAVPAKPKAVNHILVIDCSGSMSYELPKIRDQVKRKLPTMINEGDTVSLIGFSGKKEVRVILEGESVTSLKDLLRIDNAVDRFLTPIGMTGFLEPIQEAEHLAAKLTKNGNAASLFFMSDGCDNQWPRATIINALEVASKGFASATFVEYGYYADRPLLTQMAEKAGGVRVFAQDFHEYEPLFTNALKRPVSGAKKVECPIEGDVIGGFCFHVDYKNQTVTTYSAEAGKVEVEEGREALYYLSPTPVIGLPVNPNTGHEESAVYAAISLFATRMRSDVVLALLRDTGDVKLIDQFANCFGKQRYSAFEETVNEAVYDTGKRLLKGRDSNRVPPEDAFNVFDLLRILEESDSKVLLDHPSFQYNRIGKQRVDAAGEDRLVFELDPNQQYTMEKLVYNEERPNVSFMVVQNGVVRLEGRSDLPASWGIGNDPVPGAFRTKQYRNFTVIKDGLLNVKKLPVKVSGDTWSKLTAAGLPDAAATDVNPLEGTVVFDLETLPIINRQMVKSVEADGFFRTQLALTRAQAAFAVYNGYLKKHVTKAVTQGLQTVLGKETADWLAARGVTDGGFNPKKKTAKARDVYMSKELKASIKGLASGFPSLTEAQTKIEAYKEKVAKGDTKATLPGPVEMMKPYIDHVENFINNPNGEFQKAADKQAMMKAFLEGEARLAQLQTRNYLRSVARDTFTIIVGQTWFKEFKSLDQNVWNFDDNGKTYEGKAELREKEVEI